MSLELLPDRSGGSGSPAVATALPEAKRASHIPLHLRAKEPTAEERMARYGRIPVGLGEIGSRMRAGDGGVAAATVEALRGEGNEEDGDEAEVRPGANSTEALLLAIG